MKKIIRILFNTLWSIYATVVLVLAKACASPTHTQIAQEVSSKFFF